jgi:hypothetical protein
MSDLLPHARRAPRRRARLITLLTVALAAGFAAALTLVPAAAQAATTCSSGASEGMNPYYILDNEYNSSLGTSSSWQCVWSTSQSGDTIVWGADWNWAHASSSTSSDVLAYPAAVLGWEWGWQFYSFVRTSTTTSSSLTITDFTKVLTGSYGLNSSYYLSSVQAGVEVWAGEGQIDSNSYSVTVG